MFTAFARLLLVLLVALSVAAAPCRNCVPVQPASDSAPAEEHDCCPKSPASEPCDGKQEPGCAWQPSDSGQVAVKKDVTSPVLAVGCEPLPSVVILVPSEAPPLPFSAAPSPPGFDGGISILRR